MIREHLRRHAQRVYISNTGRQLNLPERKFAIKRALCPGARLTLSGTGHFIRRPRDRSPTPRYFTPAMFQCSRCANLIRSGESDCPFCGTKPPRVLASSLLGVGLAVGLGSQGCVNSGTPNETTNGESANATDPSPNDTAETNDPSVSNGESSKTPTGNSEDTVSGQEEEEAAGNDYAGPDVEDSETEDEASDTTTATSTDETDATTETDDTAEATTGTAEGSETNSTSTSDGSTVSEEESEEAAGDYAGPSPEPELPPDTSDGR